MRDDYHPNLDGPAEPVGLAMDSAASAGYALAGCPFCGKAPQVAHRAASQFDGSGFLCFISCFCGGFTSTANRYGKGDTPELAQEAARTLWNTRA